LSADDGTTLAELGDVQGFFWDGGAMYPINPLGGGKSIAADLNNKDQVVGGALTDEGATHAILWTLGADKKGIIKDLGRLWLSTNLGKLSVGQKLVIFMRSREFYCQYVTVSSGTTVRCLILEHMMISTISRSNHLIRSAKQWISMSLVI
jgi:hypothetical protein